MLNLNDFSREVHQNAKDHGWWEEEHSKEEIFACIHSEWSEALEEYRAKRPMVWYNTCDAGDDCGGGGRCGADVFECVCKGHATQGGCPGGHKPEGIAVELIDGCLRILNVFSEYGYTCQSSTISQLNKRMRISNPLLSKDTSLCTVICALHSLTVAACDRAFGLHAKEVIAEAIKPLEVAMGVAFFWIAENGLNPEALLLEKHEYNKTRPYKHGGKRC